MLRSTFIIPLTRGKVAFVDEDDWYRLNKYNWYAGSSGNVFYAKRDVVIKGKKLCFYMHREILGLRKNDSTYADHINHNTLDNRKGNLKVVTNRENHQNLQKHSKYGVGIEKQLNRFRARATFDGKWTHIGSFKTIEEAKIAREFAVKQYEESKL